MTLSSHPNLVTAGLFAGIGGLELGFRRAGMETRLLVENSPAAAHVLKARLGEVELLGDVREVDSLPSDVTLVAAGFPCQDLSSVGEKRGITGARSSLVGEVFRLLRVRRVEWVVLENVPFLLQLGAGRAMELVVSELERLGYSWAYRVLDSQAFGLPHRRRRWFLIASLHGDPRSVLLSGNAARPPEEVGPVAGGFYWTEGMRALGWERNVIPPIKGGSTVGVASPPAILMADGRVVTPDIRDGERFQGFPADWTLPAEEVVKRGFRWQLVGNAVTVNVADWLAHRVVSPLDYDGSQDRSLSPGSRWPYAAWGTPEGQRFASEATPWPVWLAREPLGEFLKFPQLPLSVRAASGFLARTRKGSLRFPPSFIEAVELHITRQEVVPEELAS